MILSSKKEEEKSRGNTRDGYLCRFGSREGGGEGVDMHVQVMLVLAN